MKKILKSEKVVPVIDRLGILDKDAEALDCLEMGAEGEGH
jgi:hypothetical protein